MTVTITYKSPHNPATEVFTQVTDCTVTGDVVKIVGVNPEGVKGTFYRHWSDCEKIDIT